MYRYPTKPKATKMDPYSSRIRHMVINYLMTETTDENLIRRLTVAQYTYCDSLWSQRWTRSKQKAFTEWLEYMEKCVEMAKNVSWGDIAILHIDEDEQETLFRRDDFFDEGHYQTDTNEENVEMINDWTDEHISGEDEEPDIVFCCTGCDKQIIRNSEDHDLSKFDPENEDNWYCVSCPVPEEEDETDDEDDTTGEELFVQMVAEMVGGRKTDDEEEKQYYKVCCAENPDVEYFDTLHEAKAFCDKHDLEYGLIMLCDFEKNEIGDWGDYEEEDDGISPMIATADSRAHEIISHRAKYGNAPLFENNIVFGNFFSREQFAEEVPAGASDYFDEFQEHIHRLGREGYFNELMKEYFEEWLETNQ